MCGEREKKCYPRFARENMSSASSAGKCVNRIDRGKSPALKNFETI